MKKHKQIYMDHFKIGIDEMVLCEVCDCAAVDIPHVRFKSQGGTDEIHNLIALCRDCHDESHGKVKGKELLREDLFKIIDRRA
jgi:5-methylcytosine-specific restriction endonuclease McrA